MGYEDQLPIICTVSHYIYVARSLLKPFSFHNDVFHKWLNAFEYIADIIRVPDNKMLEFFFTVVDNNAHRCVKSMFPFFNFSEISYDKIILKYYNFFYPSGGKTESNRKRFLCRIQFEQETIESYADH